MKQHASHLMIALILMVPFSASAKLIGGIEVGYPDSLIGVFDYKQADLSDQLFNLTGYTKDEFGEEISGSGGETGNWSQKGDFVAFDLSADSEYFWIKTGKGLSGVSLGETDKTPGDLFIFENKQRFNKAVIDLSLFSRDRGQITLDVISHVRQSGSQVAVAEPGILVLFGAGLMGLGFARKKNRK